MAAFCRSMGASWTDLIASFPHSHCADSGSEWRAARRVVRDPTLSRLPRTRSDRLDRFHRGRLRLCDLSDHLCLESAAAKSDDELAVGIYLEHRAPACSASQLDL